MIRRGKSVRGEAEGGEHEAPRAWMGTERSVNRMIWCSWWSLGKKLMSRTTRSRGHTSLIRPATSHSSKLYRCSSETVRSDAISEIKCRLNKVSRVHTCASVLDELLTKSLISLFDIPDLNQSDLKVICQTWQTR